MASFVAFRASSRTLVGLVAASAAIAVLLGGCGQGDSPGAAAGAGVPATDPTATTPSEVDVADVAREWLNGDSLEATMTASLVFERDGVRVKALVKGQVRGDDSDLSMVMRAGGDTVRERVITVDDVEYQRDSAGPWVRQPAERADDPSDMSPDFPESIPPLTDEGTATRAGEPVHRLVADPADLTAEVFDLPRGSGGFRAELTVFAQDDGRPVGMVAWTRWTDRGSTSRIEFDVALAPPNVSLPVQAPSDPWKPQRLSAGVSYAVPEDWRRELDEGAHRWFGLTSEQMLVGSDELPYGVSVDAYAAGFLSAVDDRGGTIESRTPVSVDGSPGLLVTFTEKDEGVRYSGRCVMAVSGDTGLVAIYWNRPGEEAADRALVQDFVETVAFTG